MTQMQRFWEWDYDLGGADAGRGAERARAVPPEDAGGSPQNGFRYTIKNMVDTFGISRTNLLYYEKIGIVTPERTDESSYRIYSETDVFRLMGAILLRNVGTAPRDLASRLNDEPFSREHFSEYLAAAQGRLSYDWAVLGCLRNLESLVGHVGLIALADIEPYYICWDNAEQGYHDFPTSQNLSLLMDHIPLGSFGSYGNDPYVSENDVSIKWGRTVSLRNAALIPQLDLDMDVIGGYRCVCFVHFEPDLYAMTRSQEFACADRERIAAFMEQRRLRQVGRAFWPYTLPSGEGFYVLTCIPVGPMGMPRGEASPSHERRRSSRWMP